MLDYARQLRGIAATIEHRYFGNSTPFGPDKSYMSDGFKYLTLDNVMDDSVKFIAEIQANVTEAKHSRAIMASGSYGGFLATAFRLNRPDTFYGSIAAAPSISSFPVDENTAALDRFGWWDWVRNLATTKSLWNVY